MMVTTVGGSILTQKKLGSRNSKYLAKQKRNKDPRSKMRECVNAYGKQKKTFKTFEDAVKWAKRMNQKPTTIHKQVAYKCSNCLKFHTGRSKHNTVLHHDTNPYERPTN